MGRGFGASGAALTWLGVKGGGTVRVLYERSRGQGWGSGSLLALCRLEVTQVALGADDQLARRYPRHTDLRLTATTAAAGAGAAPTGDGAWACGGVCPRLTRATAPTAAAAAAVMRSRGPHGDGWLMPCWGALRRHGAAEDTPARARAARLGLGLGIA